MSLKRVTLNDLNLDVLYLILLTLHNVSRHSLFSMLRANRALHDVTLQVLYRSCVLDVSPGQRESTIARIESWLLEEGSRMLPLIRNITLKGSVYRHQHNEALVDTGKWTFVIQLLAGIPSLASFTFDYPEQLPINLLDALHRYHPSTHLHIRNWTRIATNTTFGDPAEEALANSPCLRSLHGDFVTGGASADFRNAAFDRIAKLSPNLTAISRSSRSGGGCVVYGFSVEDMRKQNQELKKFSVKAPRQKSIQSVELSYVDAYALKDLSSYVLLDRIVTFKSTQLTPDFFHLASEDHNYRFGSLKFLELKLDSGEIAAAFSGFLAFCGPLESLSIVLKTSQPWGPTLSAILHHHSQSIHTLSLHQVESSKESMRQYLSPDELVEVRHACPELASLALDIDREKQESAYYAILGQFRHLHELTVHMGLGLALPSIYPRADEGFALNIWKKVSNDGVQLRELILYLGEQDRKIGSGYIARWVLKEQEERHWVRIQRNERDDRPGEIEVKISQDWRADWIKRSNMISRTG